jgi:probable phosphoglycerate mutase
MKLYIVRHAQSRRNAGHESKEDSELDDIGREQARRLGKYFHKVGLERVYCSTLRRAKATLKEIKPHIRGVPITYTPRIIEYKIGIYGNDGHDDWAGYVKGAENKGVPFHLFKPKHGDSLAETYDRAGSFYRDLLKRHSLDDVLVVGHGIFSLYLILNALGLDLFEGKYYSLSNASVSTLNVKKGKVTDFHVNDYDHLIREGMKK